MSQSCTAPHGEHKSLQLCSISACRLLCFFVFTQWKVSSKNCTMAFPSYHGIRDQMVDRTMTQCQHFTFLIPINSSHFRPIPDKRCEEGSQMLVIRWGQTARGLFNRHSSFHSQFDTATWNWDVKLLSGFSLVGLLLTF